MRAVAAYLMQIPSPGLGISEMQCSKGLLKADTQRNSFSVPLLLYYLLLSKHHTRISARVLQHGVIWNNTAMCQVRLWFV